MIYFVFLYFCAIYSSCFSLNIVKEYHPSCKVHDRKCIIWTDHTIHNGCYIYETPECKTFNFSEWTSVEPIVLTSDNDSPYTVDVISYILADVAHFIKISPSFNITIKSYSSDITGFVWNLSEKQGEYNSCRIFDFRNSSLLKTPFLFSYECYYDLDHENIHTYLLKVRSLPNNKELSYQINVPHMLKNDLSQDAINPCRMETTIMINLGSLNKNIVEIKFQKASDFWNVSQYEICLLIKESEIQKTVIKRKILNIKKLEDGQLASEKFHDVDQGIYYISVMPYLLNKKETCKVTFSDEFVIFSSIQKTSLYYIWIIGIIFAIILIAVVSFILYKRNRKSNLSNPTVLLVYCSESEEHMKVIAFLSEYLKKCFSIEVLVDLWLLNDDPNEWLIQSLCKDPCVIIVLSNGMKDYLKNSAKQTNVSISTNNNSFQDSWTVIKNELGRKKFIKIYFDYFNTDLIPSELKLKSFGPEFHLMKDFKKFLCYLFDINFVCGFSIPLLDSPYRDNLISAINSVKESQIK